jgi:hypothetical protein
MREIVSIENLTNPGVDPVDGDMIKITYSDNTSVEKIMHSVDQTIPEAPIRIITVAAFLDRMDVNGKINLIYQAIDAQRQADPPSYDLFKVMENLKRREYIDLDDPRIPFILDSVGIYTTEEMDTILADGVASEEPETV